MTRDIGIAMKNYQRGYRIDGIARIMRLKESQVKALLEAGGVKGGLIAVREKGWGRRIMEQQA